MANLTPTPGFDDVYQIEPTDRVLGGEGGVANTQAQALLNRSELVRRGFPVPFFDAEYISSVGGYNTNAFVMLDSGDIVQSTVDNNTEDPNTSMLGWKLFLSASRVMDNSGLTQQQINDSFEYGLIYLSRLGAKFDGTDETAILQNAISLADNETTIVFDGPFKFSSVDFGVKTVSLRGVRSISAQTLKTVVTITGAGIICNTQKVKLDSIDFRSSGNKNDGANISLLTNNKNNGTWLHMKSIRASGFSGHVLYNKDLIDSEISDFIPNNNNVVFSWHKDAWVANTTIKLNKVYAQLNNLLFDADDCDHCLMVDCIYEFNASLGHSDNSSWTVINLYTENNSAPMTLVNSYLLSLHHYPFTANDRFVVTQPGINPLDRGVVTILQRSLTTSQISKGFERLENIAPSFSGQTWTKLGTAYLTQAGYIQIEIVGASSFTQPAAPSAIQAVGKTVILAQAKNDSQATQPNIHATMFNLGVSTGVSQCRLVQIAGSRTSFEVYILQDSSAYVGFSVMMGKGDYFEKDVQRLQPKPTGGGSGDVNTSTMLIVFNYARLSAGTAYVGSDGTNPTIGAVSSTTVGATGSAAVLPANPVGYVTININGTNYKMPYYNV